MSLEELDNAVAAYKQALEVRNQAGETKATAEAELTAAKAFADESSKAHADAVKAAGEARDAVKAAADALLV